MCSPLAPHDEVRFPAENSPARAAEGCDHAKQRSQCQFAPCEFEMFTRRQDNSHTGERCQPEQNLPEGQGRSEPEPLDQSPQRCRQTLNEQQGQACSQPGQSLEKCDITDADS
jgi:hypothetical protein